MADRESDHRFAVRRNILAFAGTAGATLVARPAAAGMALPRPYERRLALHNLHTDERLETTFWRRGAYRRSACLDIDHILRDWRTGEVARIDRGLLDCLHELCAQVGAQAPIQVISGYRSPETNAMLVKAGNGGVAKNSYHVRAMAIDIRLPDCALKRLHRAAVSLRRGGVGYYPASGFIHVDTGPVRTW